MCGKLQVSYPHGICIHEMGLAVPISTSHWAEAQIWEHTCDMLAVDALGDLCFSLQHGFGSKQVTSEESRDQSI